MRYSLLIVDDDEVDRYMLKRLIKKTQLDVIVFEKTNGLEALEFFRDYEANRSLYHEDYPPLLCLLDINMPLMNGWEFLSHYSKIRNFEDLHTTAVMLVSSSSYSIEDKRILDFDFIEGYIVKGDVTADQLKEIIVSSDPRG